MDANDAPVVEAEQIALGLPRPPGTADVADKPKASQKRRRYKKPAPEIIHITDIKDDRVSMEHPMFALQAGDKRIRIYERNGVKVKIKPGADGCATIHDKDLWLYCISFLVEKINRGRAVTPTVKFTAYDFMKATRRDTGGDSYKRFGEMLARLAGTRIETNIATAGQRERRGFGLIDSWRVVEKSPDNARMVAVEVDLPRWLFRSIEDKQVLTISRDYFGLRKGLDRRLYELARKHCGKQSAWSVSLTILHEKSGSTQLLKHFRSEIRALAERDNLPEYTMRFDSAKDVVTFHKSQSAQAFDALVGQTPRLPGL